MCVCHRHMHTPWTKLRARAAMNTLLLGATLIEGTGAELSKGAATQISCGIHPCLQGPSGQDGKRATAGHQGCHTGARCGPRCPQMWPLGPPHAPHGPGPATGRTGTCGTGHAFFKETQKERGRRGRRPPHASPGLTLTWTVGFITLILTGHQAVTLPGEGDALDGAAATGKLAWVAPQLCGTKGKRPLRMRCHLHL